VFLLRPEQGLNYIKIQEIKGYLVLYNPRNSRTLSRTCKSHVTWVSVQKSTFAWINQEIEAFTRLMSKKIINVHLRLWTLKY